MFLADKNETIFKPLLIEEVFFWEKFSQVEAL